MYRYGAAPGTTYTYTVEARDAAEDICELTSAQYKKRPAIRGVFRIDLSTATSQGLLCKSNRTFRDLATDSTV